VSRWKPREIIIHRKVRNDPVTKYLLAQCPGVPVRVVKTAKSTDVVKASKTLQAAGKGMLSQIRAGKKVVFIAPAATDVVDVFEMPDDRMVCPHFDRLKLASNGCFYECDWCYLKLTYRAAFPFITVRAEYDKIKARLERRLARATGPVMFNSGELADSLSLDHLTRAGQEFIPWFGRQENGYLFMLTKSDNVSGILDLEHNGHTVIAWSMNQPDVSRKFEVGAPSFERRLRAAEKVQAAGYPVRIRLDPIVPIKGWKRAYAATVREIFSRIQPERVTLGTLRFEEGFHRMRQSIFTTGPDLPGYLERMEPMFPPMVVPGMKKPKVGKYSFTEDERAEIFDYVLGEVRKRSDCRVALCKESAAVWNRVGLPLSRCACVCQFESADMEPG